MAPVRIFVYGTLKPGESNYQRYCASKVVQAQAAIALGKIFALPMGCPAMTTGHAPVQGYLLSFTDPDILPWLDELEDYDPQRPANQNWYNRQLIETYTPDGKSLGLAWIYLMTPNQIKEQGGVLIANGCWTSYYRYLGRVRRGIKVLWSGIVRATVRIAKVEI